jgi:hypothetical protein
MGTNSVTANTLNLRPTMRWMRDGVGAELYTLMPVIKAQRYRSQTGMCFQFDIPQAEAARSHSPKRSGVVVLFNACLA